MIEKIPPTMFPWVNSFTIAMNPLASPQVNTDQSANLIVRTAAVM